MICKILNQNYLSMPYLPRIIVAVFLGMACLLVQSAISSPKIINGQTADDNNDQSCSEADLAQYVEKIKKDIQAKWQPVKGFADRHIATVFTIRQNGAIEDAKIVESSGSQEADQSALTALKAASPLSPLPKGAPESIQIRYVFSWQVR